jgi:hypothetical protein
MLLGHRAGTRDDTGDGPGPAPAYFSITKRYFAHETLMYVLSGGVRVLIEGAAIQARESHVVYAHGGPFTNTGDGELRILAVTYFGLATRAFVGDSS